MKEGNFFIRVIDPSLSAGKYVIGKIVKLDGSNFFGKNFKVKIYISKGTNIESGFYGENSMLLAGAFTFSTGHLLVKSIFTDPEVFLGYRTT